MTQGCACWTLKTKCKKATRLKYAGILMPAAGFIYSQQQNFGQH
jgi:hypothetical protein